MAAKSSVRLKITLDDVAPEVLRRILVPLDIRLDRLHLALQAAMGWTNTHLWEIRMRGVGFGPPDPHAGWGAGPQNAAKATLAGALEDIGAKTFTYLYDFGDGWEHTIKVEAIIDAPADVDLPLLVEAQGACPPEDVGGPWGYAEFREALSDPAHERHAELVEEFGEAWDADDPGLDAINSAFAALAKSWARKPAARKTKKK